MKESVHRFRTGQSLFWRYFFLLVLMLCLFLAALTLVSRQSARVLRESYLEQAQQSFYHNCDTFSSSLQRTFNLMDSVESAQFYSYAKRASAPLDSEENYYLHRVGQAFLQQCALLNLPGESFLYFHQARACTGNGSYFSRVEECFSNRLIYQNGQSMPELLASCVEQRTGTMSLLPTCPVSVKGAEPVRYLTLLLQSSPRGQVYGFLYSEQAILDSFHMSALPEDSCLELIHSDGTVLFSHNGGADPAGYTQLSARIPVLSATVVLGIPHSYFQQAIRQTQSTVHLIFLLCVILGLGMCLVVSHVSVRPFRRLIRDHAADGSIGSLAEGSANELVIIDQALKHSRQKSEELRGILLSSLLVRTFSGIPVSSQEWRRLSAALPMFQQSMQAAIVRDWGEGSESDGGTDMIDLLRSVLPAPFLCEYVNLRECVVLFRAEPVRLEQLRSVLLALNSAAAPGSRFVCGVSAPFLGVSEIGTAVDQARFCVPAGDGCVVELYSGEEAAGAEASEEPFDLRQFQRALTGWDREEILAQLEQLVLSAGQSGGLRAEELFYSVLYLLREAASLGNLCFDDHAKAAWRHNEDAAFNLRCLRVIADDLLEQRAALQRSEKRQLCEDIVQYMRDSFADQTLCMASLSRAFCVSEGFVRGAVQSVTGMSFTGFLNTVRVEYAARLLRETDEPNAAVAEQCGYTTMNTFYRNFRRYFHISPAEYKSAWGRRAPSGPGSGPKSGESDD